MPSASAVGSRSCSRRITSSAGGLMACSPVTGGAGSTRTATSVCGSRTRRQYVSPGTPLLDILETGQLEVQMIVPSRWLAWLKPGAPFTVEVEELGRRFPAKVRRLGAQIDPVSQTVPVVGVIDSAHPELLPGMSGWAVYPQRK